MRWIVGVDLLERSDGAVRMAAWLRENRHAEPPPEFVAVHVLDERIREAATMRDVEAQARRALSSAIDRSGVEDPFTDVCVVLAPSVETGLARAVVGPRVDGLVIGRIAPRMGRSLVRLGSVARKVLRSLPVPVLVVPPDLAERDVGAGGIVVATDLGETSVAAALFAARLASGLQRPLIAAHVDPSQDVGRDLLGDRTILAAWTPRRTLADVDAWVRAHDVPAHRTTLAEEGVVEGLLGVAQREDAAIIACGSRRLGTIDRIFTSSVGTDLARLADRPVLVVPSA